MQKISLRHWFSQEHPIWPCEPSPFSKRSRTLAAVVFCVAGLLILGIDWRLRLLAADDSYIHLRIARHLLENRHAFFNTNERVMVTSSPLWTVVLALSSVLCKGFPPAIPIEAVTVGLACAIGFLLAVSFSGCQELSPVARNLYRAVIPCAVFGLLLQSAVFQMETPLAVMLMLASVFLWHRRTSWWLSVAVLAAWVRYEYFVLAFLLFMFAAMMRQLKAKTLVLAAITFLLGVTWLEYQFGTLVPNTVKAKAVAYVIPAFQTFRSLGFGWLRCLLLAAVVLAFVRSKSYKRLTVLDILFFGGLVLDVLYITRKAMIFLWYPPLTLAPVVLGLLLGMALVNRGWIRVLAIATPLLFLPVGSIPYEVFAAATGKPWTDHPDDFNIRTREYITVGRAVYRACPNGRLLTSEIGGLGEGFRGEILDGFGLATPAATKYHPLRIPEDRPNGNSGAIPVGFVVEAKPDIIVSYDVFSDALRKRYDRAAYTLFEYAPLPTQEGPHYRMWNGSRLFIFVAKHGACSAQSVDLAVRKELATE